MGERYSEGDESLQTRVQDLERALAEVNDSAHAFKLLNEKQIAELNTKDLLLARKNERIEELAQQLQDRDAQLTAKTSELETFQERVRTLQKDIDDLQDQLQKEEEEFTMICAALDAKEQALLNKNQELHTASDLEKQLRKELERSQTIIRRLEKNVDDLHPEQADACLSPRSFHENQLIQLRDDAIQAKTREVWLLTGQNDQLRVQLDELETAMEQLQTIVISKENDVSRKQRKIEKLEMEIEALQVSRSQAQGREKAMEIATTQNAKLLQGLEMQERINVDLEQRAQRAERECEQLRVTHRGYIEKAAVNEVEALHKTKEVEEKASIVNGLQEKLQRERKALQQELSTVHMTHQLATEKMQSELVMRRNKQYELTLKLQDVEARLHDAMDGLDTSTEQLQATQCRMEEFERVLKDALNWKKLLEEQLTKQKNDAATDKEQIAKRLEEAQQECCALKSELKEVQACLVKKIDQEKFHERTIFDFKHFVGEKENVIREYKQRINRLVHEVNRESQLRSEVEREKHALSNQLEKLRQQMETSIRDCLEQKRKAEDKCKQWQERQEQLESEYAKHQSGKSRLVSIFSDAFTAATGVSRSSWIYLECLDLSACWLSDHDLRYVLTMLENAPDSLIRVDLRSNRITYEGMRVMVNFVKKLVCTKISMAQKLSQPQTGSNSSIRDIDLRNNYISIDGIRTLASTIESMITTNSTKSSPNSINTTVTVKNGGRIECFVDEKRTIKLDPNPLRVVPALVIDITSNFDPDDLVEEMRKSNRRRAAGTDAENSKRSSNNTVASMDTGIIEKTKDVPTAREAILQEIYGVDLVSTFFSSDIGSLQLTNRRPSNTNATDKVKGGRLATNIASYSDTTHPRSIGEGAKIVDNVSSQTSSVVPLPRDGSNGRLATSLSLPKLPG